MLSKSPAPCALMVELTVQRYRHEQHGKAAHKAPQRNMTCCTKYTLVPVVCAAILGNLS